MYVWEIFGFNSTQILFIISILMIPILFILLVALNTNNYWKKLNTIQKKYWLIAMFTGIINSLFIMAIFCITLLKLFIPLIEYVVETENFLMLTILGISQFILIIITIKKINAISNIISSPIIWWKKFLETELNFNINFKEEKAVEQE